MTVPDPSAAARGTDPVTRVLDLIASAMMAFSGLLMVGLIAIFGWLVFGRYILNDTPTWAEQSALLMVVWITFLAAAVGVRRGTHLAVDFIREALPRPLRLGLRVLAILLMGAFGGLMAWQGWGLVEFSARREIPLLGLSESWRYVPLVISGTMIVIFCLEALRRELRAARSET